MGDPVCNYNNQNHRWKLGQKNAICWNYLGLFWDYGLDHILIRNKTFLFFKIESWNLLFNQTTDRTIVNRKFLDSLNELKLFQTDAESFSFLSWETKKFYSLKKYFLSRTAKIDPKNDISRPNFPRRFWISLFVMIQK